MAEEKPEVSEEVDEEVATPTGRGRWLVLGAAALVALAAGGGGLFWLGMDGGDPQTVAESEPSFEIEAGREFAAELGLLMPEPQVGAGEPGGEAFMGKMVSLEPFVVNISDGERDRYLKLKAEIELSDAAVADELNERMPQIRDLLISLLGGKAFEEIRTIEGKNFLREEMLLRINSLLVSGEARRIFFTDFVVQ